MRNKGLALTLGNAASDESLLDRVRSENFLYSAPLA
jgi:hypothetical protein